MIHPDFKEAHTNEVNTRGIDDVAYDEVEYVELESAEDWLEKARAIFLGEDYDTRVQVPVEFTDEELLTYMRLAHERDITFNQLIEDALRSAIEDYKRDPEGMKQRAESWKREKNIL